MLKSLLFAAAIAAASIGGAQAAPRDELLVNSAWLAQHAADKDLVILHVGTPDGYKAKHIPGAHLVGPNGLTVKTPEGLVTELPPSSQAPDYLGDFTSVNGRLFFTYPDDRYGLEPWVSDGTADGTAVLRDINREPTSSSPGRPTWSSRGRWTRTPR